MAHHAQRADVLEIRIAAFDNWEDVVRFPPAFPAAGNLQLAHLDHAAAEGEAEDAAAERHRIDPADCADPAVALEHALAQVRRARAEAPLMDAGVGAERAAAATHRPLAPPARRPPLHGASIARQAVCNWRMACVDVSPFVFCSLPAA